MKKTVQKLDSLWSEKWNRFRPNSSVVSSLSISLFALGALLLGTHRAEQDRALFLKSTLENSLSYELSGQDPQALAFRLNALQRELKFECLIGTANGVPFFKIESNDQSSADKCNGKLLRGHFNIRSQRVNISASLLPSRGTSLIFIGFILLGISSSLVLMSLRQRKIQLIQKNKERIQENLIFIATQVAHDIRSPLAALSMAERDLSALPEETRLIIRSAIGRIQDIASQLMAKANESKLKGETFSAATTEVAPEKAEPTLVSATLESLLAEKRLQYRSRLGLTIDSSIDHTAHSAFSVLGPREFKRVLSNLINNAAESIPPSRSGTIRLQLKHSADGKNLTLEIKDTGQGIPEDILLKLGTRGFSHNKAGGSGLGIHHARMTIEALAGNLDIQSTVGQGTTLKITLPTCAPPSWFLPSLELAASTQLVILDDDQSIHQVWKGRMESAQATQHGIELLHFSSPEEIARWHTHRDQNANNKPVRYLLDYEILGSSMTGLDLIEKLGIQREAVLVTSRYEEPTLRNRCAKAKVPILPKGLAGFVAISFSYPTETAPLLDAVLLDDDVLIHMTWAHAAKVFRKNLRIFKNPTDLQGELSQIPPGTPIYIDSNLGGGVKGEDWIQKLSQMGFKNLYLATGYHPKKFEDRLKDLPGFQGVVGKDPPKWT